MRKSILVLVHLAFVLANSLTAQTAPTPKTTKPKAVNLVINHSFEDQTAPNAPAIAQKTTLNQLVGWDSPNLGEPVVFGTTDKGNIYDNYGSSWAFKAKSGKNVGGLGVSTERDYLQGSLSKPLTVGKKYIFWFFVHYHCSGANNIGIVFLPNKTKLTRDGVLPLKPAAYQKEITKYTEAKTWALVRDSFVAQEPYQYFIIGNFASKEDTEYEGLTGHYFAYIDDVAVVEANDQKTGMPTAAKVEADKKEWAENLAKVEKIKNNPSVNLSNSGKDEPLVLPSILFKLDTDELLSESYTDLDNLVAQMQRKTSLRIQIIGHTSTEGDTGYNQALSERRAAAIKAKLVEKGIDDTRLEAVGKGESEPLVEEKTSTDRAKNRRVVVVVL
jgi:outer membrane protein OmpA-like peptidoglycan-associated protein